MNRYPYVGSTLIEPQRTNIILPAFSYVPVWTGVCMLMARYPVGNTVPFSLTRPITHPSGNFVLAVSWAEDPYVYRYKLAELGISLLFPVYDGERIGATSYIEVWSTSASNATMANDFTLSSSQLIEPSCLTQICDNGTTSILLVAAPFTSVPATQYCNPFCTPLCT